MKKGFTLIELLAVILILGIIALIAIPTVNKILNEAREGAFRTTSDNVMKAMEQACQTELIKGIAPTLTYTFSDGKSNSNLELKGTMPDDGYVFLDRECSVTDYYLKDQNYVYSNGEDIRKDYMLQAPTEEETSIFKTLYPTYYDNISSVSFIDNLNIPEGAIEIKNPSMSDKNKIKSWLIQNGSNYDLYVGSEGVIYANYDSSYILSGLTIATTINLSNFNTSFTKNMNGMFLKAKSITNLDISNLNSSNVTNMAYMFSECLKLLSLNVSHLDTTNVNTMDHMFNGCKALENLIGSHNLVNSKVEDIFCMFYQCVNLKTIDSSNWDTRNIVKMTSAFMYCKKLINLDSSNWNTSKVTSMRNLFNQCNEIKKIDVSKWDTSNVTDMSEMFSNCRQLVELDVSKWNTNNLSSLKNMFLWCSSLTSIDVSNFNTSAVTNMAFIFTNCHNLEEIDVSRWDTSNVTTMNSLFYDCNMLETIDLSNWNTSSVTDLSYMFYGCDFLETIDLSNWNIDGVTNMVDIFVDCNNLNNLKLANINVSNKIDDYLPTRTEASPGLLTIIGDKTGLDATTLNNKYWNVA